MKEAVSRYLAPSSFACFYLSRASLRLSSISDFFQKDAERAEREKEKKRGEESALRNNGKMTFCPEAIFFLPVRARCWYRKRKRECVYGPRAFPTSL